MSETKQHILETAQSLFARGGYEAFSARKLAEKSEVGLSSIYHFFDDKDAILHHLFRSVGQQLGGKRRMLTTPTTASAQLRQIIEFQFTNIEQVVFILKYYMHFRSQFTKLDSGYIPDRAYLHIREVLETGADSGEFYVPDGEITQQSKILTHAINGFLLEYYPDSPSGEELGALVDDIHGFLIRSLTNKEVAMK